MADDKLIFPVEFDVEGGVDTAKKDWNAKKKEMEKAFTLDVKVAATTVNSNQQTKVITEMTKETKKRTTAEQQVQKELTVTGDYLRSLAKQYKNINTSGFLGSMSKSERAQYTSFYKEMEKESASAARESEKLARAQERSAKLTETSAKNTKNMSSYAAVLVQRWLTYNALAQSVNFVRSIRETTAEFELQRVSLGALIQDAERADALFNKIKVAAVESPYEIKDLVSYTKQLAAYGFQQEELFGTMMRLADVASGLGVGFDRIVLAYGQVAAKGHLAGTELKQFTEAGIPLVKSLAESFSELEGQVVTTGEVFDRISNKQVSFGDVESIFEDMTSEGGRFYEMQKVQAKTLAGMWSNLQDSISIAMDEMGRDNRGVMVDMIAVVKSLWENWSTVKDVLQVVGISFIVIASQIKAISILMKSQHIIYDETTKKVKLMATAWNHLKNGAVTAGKAIKSALLPTGIGLAIGLIITGVMKLIARNKELKESFDAINKEAKKFSKETKDAYNEVRDTIERGFGDNAANEEIALSAQLLDDIISKNTALNPLVKQRLQDITDEKARLEELKKLWDEIEISSGGLVATQDLTKAYKDVFTGLEDGLVTDLNQTDKAVQTLMEDLRDVIDEYKYDDLGKWFDDIQTDFRSLNASIAEGKGSFEAIDQLLQDIVMYDTENIFGIQPSEAGVFGRSAYIRTAEGLEMVTGSAAKFSSRLQEANMDAKSLFDEILRRTETSTGMKIDITADWFGLGEDGFNEFQTAFNLAVGNFIKGFEDMSSASSYNFKLMINDYFQARNTFVKYPLIPIESPEERYIAQGWSAMLNQDIIEISEAFGDYNKAIEVEVDKSGAETEDSLKRFDKSLLTQFTRTAKNQEEGLDQVISTVSEKLKGLNDRIKAESEREGTQYYNPQLIASLKNQVEILEAFRARLTTTPLDFGGGDDGLKTRAQQLQEEAELIQKLYSRYNDYLKILSEDDAKKKIQELAQTVIPSFDQSQLAFTPEMLIESLTRIQEKIREVDPDAAIELQFKINDLNISEIEEELKEKLQEMQDRLARTQESSDFFNKILGLTGNRDVAMTLTMSVYGDIAGGFEGDVAQNLANSTKDALQAAFGDIDISQYFDSSGKIIDLSGLESRLPEIDSDDFRKQAEDIVETSRQAYSTQLEEYAKILETAKSFEQQRLDIDAKYADLRLTNAKLFDDLIAKEEDEAIKSRLQAQKEANDRLLRESEASEKVDVDIAEFKTTDDWKKTFKDLDQLSTESINKAVAALDAYIDKNAEAMNPEQLKPLQEARDKMYEEGIARNPYQGIVDGLDEWIIASKKAAEAKSVLDKQVEGTPEYKSALEAYNAAADEQQEAQSKFVKGLNETAGVFTDLESVLTDITDLLGISEESEAADVILSIAKALGVAAGILVAIAVTTEAINTLMESSPFFKFLSIGLSVAGLIAGIFSAASRSNVRKQNEEIERQARLIEDLEKAYERLERAQEDALGAEWIDNYNEQLANLRSQAIAAERQAQAERNKGKKEDEDATADYLQTAEDARQQILEMQEDFAKEIIGTGIGDFAKEIANIWLEAKLAGENTMDALRDKYSELMQSMVADTIMGEAIQASLQGVFDQIDRLREDSSLVQDPEYWNQFSKELMSSLELSDQILERVFQSLDMAGVSFDASNGELSGIAKNIATASEEAVLGLAAGVNTQNFYMADIRIDVKAIRAMIAGGSKGTDNSLMILQNTYLAELPNIALHTSNTVIELKNLISVANSSVESIKSLRTDVKGVSDTLSSVIKPKSTPTINVVHTNS